MARHTLEFSNELSRKIETLGSKGDEIAREAVYEAAKIVTDEIRTKGERVVSDQATGDMMASLGITPMDTDNQGCVNVKIGFDGYDRKGVPNQLKARALESGTSTIRKRPFVRPAVNATKDRAQRAMEDIVLDGITKIMK